MSNSLEYEIGQFHPRVNINTLKQLEIINRVVYSLKR